jgi:hypothetical protein
MANVKITDLTAATTPLVGTEVLEIVQSGASKKATASDIGNSATAVPFASVAGRDRLIAYNTGDVTFAVNTPETIPFDTVGLSSGITVANDGGGSPTRVTFANAGTFEIAVHAQFANADSTSHTASVWFRLNGTDIAYSATLVNVPKLADGGTTFYQVQGILQVTAGQYVEVVAAVADVDVTLDFTGAITSPYNRPSIPSMLVVVQRIA